MTRDAIQELAHVGYQLWNSNLVGGVPAANTRFDRMEKPREGDLVIEVSTAWWTKRKWGEPLPDGVVGHLERIAREPLPYKDWNEAEDGPLLFETVYYLRLFDGREFRWTNAMIVAILPAEGWGAAQDITP